jgi:methyl-accepting chemotaxis protein
LIYAFNIKYAKYFNCILKLKALCNVEFLVFLLKRGVITTMVDKIALAESILKQSAVIEFKPDGTILDANQNFLDVMGYTLNEIKGKHHSIFVESAYRNSPEYSAFWENLRQGHEAAAEFKRIAKNGDAVWIQATYHPVQQGLTSKIIKVIKVASGINDKKIVDADNQGKIDAINKVQAVIEFDLNGNILTANDNFCNTVGYTLDEIQGQHHSLFVDKTYKNSREYQQFWADLREGRSQVAEFGRVGKHGKQVWISASYNPIISPVTDKPFKIVKFATDITEQSLVNANYKGQIEAIDRSQAVIEFNLDGTIITANDNFCNTLGYTLNEIQGQHHSLFVDKTYKNSHEYQQFWTDLRNGQYQSAEFKRFAKNGNEVWIQATYNPIVNPLTGQLLKVVKFASNITAQKTKELELTGKVDAIERSNISAEWDNGGTLLHYNDLFAETTANCGAIQSTFHLSRLLDSAEFAKLKNRHSLQKDLVISRVTGEKLYINANIQPLFNYEGELMKIVMYATDNTQKLTAMNESRGYTVTLC